MHIEINKYDLHIMAKLYKTRMKEELCSLLTEKIQVKNANICFKGAEGENYTNLVTCAMHTSGETHAKLTALVAFWDWGLGEKEVFPCIPFCTF